MRVYRVILVLYSFVAASAAANILLPLLIRLKQVEPVPIRGWLFWLGGSVSFALVPVAAIGLWRLRTWGVVIMAFATALAFLADLQRAIGASLLQSLMLILSFGVWHARRRSQAERQDRPAEDDVKR